MPNSRTKGGKWYAHIKSSACSGHYRPFIGAKRWALSLTGLLVQKLDFRAARYDWKVLTTYCKNTKKLQQAYVWIYVQAVSWCWVSAKAWQTRPSVSSSNAWKPDFLDLVPSPVSAGTFLVGRRRIRRGCTLHRHMYFETSSDKSTMKEIQEPKKPSGLFSLVVFGMGPQVLTSTPQILKNVRIGTRFWIKRFRCFWIGRRYISVPRR